MHPFIWLCLWLLCIWLWLFCGVHLAMWPIISDYVFGYDWVCDRLWVYLIACVFAGDCACDWLWICLWLYLRMVMYVPATHWLCLRLVMYVPVSIRCPIWWLWWIPFDCNCVCDCDFDWMCIYLWLCYWLIVHLTMIVSGNCCAIVLVILLL